MQECEGGEFKRRVLKMTAKKVSKEINVRERIRKQSNG
jgi:hypothetical protein